MNEQTIETRELTIETESQETETQWVSADFVEQSACAEICAYVFTA
jgi:hypothetical protein